MLPTGRMFFGTNFLSTSLLILEDESFMRLFMNTFTRKEFIRTSALAVGALMAGPLFALGKKTPRLSFSTLGCPDWSLQQITDFAVTHGFRGIEVRVCLS